MGLLNIVIRKDDEGGRERRGVAGSKDDPATATSFAELEALYVSPTARQRDKNKSQHAVGSFAMMLNPALRGSDGSEKSRKKKVTIDAADLDDSDSGLEELHLPSDPKSKDHFGWPPANANAVLGELADVRLD